MIKVIQATNTEEYDQIDGNSCIRYWINNHPNGYDITFCRATKKIGTQSDFIVGGHVIAIVDGTPHVYITPIRNSVNVKDRPKMFDVDPDDLVEVPEDDERNILADEENIIRYKCLDNIIKMNKLMR